MTQRNLQRNRSADTVMGRGRSWWHPFWTWMARNTLGLLHIPLMGRRLPARTVATAHQNESGFARRRNKRMSLELVLSEDGIGALDRILSASAEEAYWLIRKVDVCLLRNQLNVALEDKELTLLAKAEALREAYEQAQQRAQGGQHDSGR